MSTLPAALLLLTGLRPPPLHRGLLLRTRLLAWRDAAMVQPVTFVAACAAFGRRCIRG